jgi:hypothetical protein
MRAIKERDRKQKMTVINAVMICVGFLVLMQTLLFNITVEGILGGEDHLVVPALVLSGICLSGSIWLMRSVYRL